MTQVIAKYAAKKMLSSEMNKYKDKAPAGQYDPFYELIPHPKKPGKMKKVKKQIPAYIPEHDANILARARKTAYRLDCCLFNFLGVRFGWSSVIGIIPAAGDALDLAFALKLCLSMSKVEGGLPAGVWSMMVFNLVVDFLVGLIPIVGDLADAAMRANSKNVRLFEQHLDKKYKPKELVEADRKAGRHRRPATVYEDFSDDEMERAGIPREGRNHDYDDDRVQQPARTYSTRRDRIVDEEMGYGRSDRHDRRDERRDDRPSRNNTRSSRR